MAEACKPKAKAKHRKKHHTDSSKFDEEAVPSPPDPEFLDECAGIDSVTKQGLNQSGALETVINKDAPSSADVSSSAAESPRTAIENDISEQEFYSTVCDLDEGSVAVENKTAELNAEVPRDVYDATVGNLESDHGDGGVVEDISTSHSQSEVIENKDNPSSVKASHTADLPSRTAAEGDVCEQEFYRAGTLRELDSARTSQDAENETNTKAEEQKETHDTPVVGDISTGNTAPQISSDRLRTDDNAVAAAEPTDVSQECTEIAFSFPRDIGEATAPPLEGNSLSLCAVEQQHVVEAGNAECENKILSHRKKIKRLYPQLKEVLDEPTMRPFAEDQILTLYDNQFLAKRTAIEKDFAEKHAEKHLDSHELYKLLIEYMKSRQHLIETRTAVRNLENDIENLQPTMWELQPRVANATGRCADNKAVSGRHSYKYAVFNESVASVVAESLQKLRKLAKEKYFLHVHNCEVLQLKINYYIHSVVSVPVFKNIPKNAPLSSSVHGAKPLSADHSDIVTVRECLSVLFVFARRPIQDKQFLDEVRKWITMLASLLLRIASIDDHLFLLNHVLCCPPGIHKWAITIVQIPRPQAWSPHTDWPVVLQSPQLDYAVAALASILLPPEARRNFLQPILSAMEASSPKDNWVVLDSDGEEDGKPEEFWLSWSENDVVLLLNQVPFSALFRHLLFITRENDEDIYQVSRTSAQGLLKLISIASHLLNIFHEGLKTFNFSRYKQLTKRISRFVRHTVEYVADHWLVYRSVSNEGDAALLLRLQVEYDQFFLRAVNCIFYSQLLGAWQFMAILPYKSASNVMMWQLLWLLHNNYKDDVELADLSPTEICNRIQGRDVKLVFEEKLNEMPQSEVFFLLTSFANMAASRDADGSSLIHVVVTEIFEITYINKQLRSTFSKEGRDLLSTLANKHPSVISVILDKIDDHMMELGNMACYLMQAMPLGMWVPEKEDLDIISHFLLYYPLGSAQSQLARLLIQSLNYGFGKANQPESKTHLNLSTHQQMGLLLLEAYQKLYVPYESSGYVYKQIKTITDFAMATKESSTPAGFVSWMWEVLFRLKLHAFDQNISLALELATADHVLASVAPSMQKCDWLHPLVQANKELQPPSLYLTLLISTVGHHRDEVLSEGLNLLSTLVVKEQYTAAIQCIVRILPLFYRHQELLTECAELLANLQCIVLADNTYIAMAKNLVQSDFPGPILKQLAVAMHGHVIQAKQWQNDTNQDFLALSLKLWLSLVCNLPDIPVCKGALVAKVKGRDNVMYLLDVLVQLAYKEARSFQVILTFFRDILAQFAPAAAAKSVVKSVFSFVLGSALAWPAMVPLPSVPEFPWFGWAGMLAEGQLQTTTDMWRSVLREMAINSKLTPEGALKKVSGYTKVLPPSADALLIYRWAHQAMQTDLEHPALPLIWQQFFLLYLQRTCVQLCGCVGQRFFESPVQFTLLKRMKRRLNESADHFFKKHAELAQTLKEQCHLCEGKGEDAKLLEMLTDTCMLYQTLTKVYRTFYLWLEEPRLHDRSITLTALPPQYAPERLSRVLEGNQELWLELVDIEKVQDNVSTLISSYETESTHCRNSVRGDAQSTLSPEERILKRLKTYEDPLRPPPVPSIKAVIPNVSEDLFKHPSRIMKVLSSELKVLVGHARVLNAQAAKLSVLDSQYMNNIPALYQNVSSQVRLTLSCSHPGGCTGPVTACLRFNQAQVDHLCIAAVDSNRAAWASVVAEVLHEPSPTVCCSMLHIEVCLTRLIQKHRTATATESRTLKALGGEVFFELTAALNQETTEYVPARQFLASCLEMIGEEFISDQPEQCLPVLKVIMKDPTMVGYIAPFFTPFAVSVDEYVRMYESIVSRLSPLFYSAIFVLLTKFDMQKWLCSKATDNAVLVRLVDAVGEALSKIGINPEKDVVQLLDMYQLHLQALLMFHFPEHYSNVLGVILRGVNTCSVPITAGYVFLHALGLTLSPGTAPGTQLFAMLREFAMKQCLLSMTLLKDTMDAIRIHFQRLRNDDIAACKQGLYGKLQPYLAFLSTFFGLLSHCLVWEACKITSQQSPQHLATVLDSIYKMYGPWLELGEGRKAYPPWLPGEIEQVDIITSIFVASLHFFHETCSRMASFSVLSEVWQRCFTMYVWNDCPEYVASALYSKLGCLPWSDFTPSVKDMMLMCKVPQKEYVGHMPLLVTVFQAVPWPQVLAKVAESEHVVKDYYSYFAEVLVRCAWYPEMRQADTLPSVIPSIVELQWRLLPVELVCTLQKIFEASCDTSSILLPHKQGTEKDKALLDFVTCLSCMVPSGDLCSDPVTVQKQQSYIGVLVRIFRKSMDTTDSLLKHHSNDIQQLLPRLMKLCQGVVNAELDHQFSHSSALIAESLTVISMMSDTKIQQVLLDGLLQWIASCSGSTILLPVLLCVCRNLASVYHMVAASEVCISNYLSSAQVPPPDGGWSQVVAVFSVPELSLSEFFEACTQKSAYFTQYCYVLHRLPQCKCLADEHALLVQLVEWIGRSVPSSEDSEPKLLLLWEKVFALSIRQLDFGANPRSVYKTLEDFCASLSILGEDKSGAGLWGAIGLGKRSTLSVRFRFCCRTVCAFVLSQLVEPGMIRLEPWRAEDTWKRSPASSQALARLKALQTNRAYVAMSSEIDEALSIVQDSSKNLRDGLSVIRTLVNSFYADRVYLRTLFFGFM
uniref:Ectopic P granules protein 5 homolog n=1 Tax=Ornithodoros turicata TaxID=34597 RepID=A0A2R5LL19_9ACAR